MKFTNIIIFNFIFPKNLLNSGYILQKIDGALMKPFQSKDFCGFGELRAKELG